MTEYLVKNILSEELFGSRICESLEDRHIVNYMYENLLLEKLLYGEPILIPELRKILRQKIVNFEFIKLDGEVRPAKGTTMMRYIPPKDHPKGIRPSSPKVATFFDLDKDAWRSVSQRSKEIVLKKDEETGKPVIVVQDVDKVKPIDRKRESTDSINQGASYDFTTNKGTDTFITILRELPDGSYQVEAPEFGTSFQIYPYRIGDKTTPPDEVKKIPKKKPFVPPAPIPAVTPSISIAPPSPPIPDVPLRPLPEEEPLDVTDTSKPADDIEDRDIIAPEVQKPIRLEPKPIVPEKPVEPKKPELPPEEPEIPPEEEEEE